MHGPLNIYTCSNRKIYSGLNWTNSYIMHLSGTQAEWI
jgi:hypothetical protein